MRNRACWLIAFGALLLWGGQSFGEEVEFRTLAQGSYSGIGQATNLVLKTKAEWERLWQRHQTPTDPPAKVPAVDFAKEMVVAAAMGQKPTGGYAIKIRRIELTTAGLKIVLAQQSPGAGAIVTQALSAPFHFVAVRKSDLKPEFRTEAP